MFMKSFILFLACFTLIFTQSAEPYCSAWCHRGWNGLSFTNNCFETHNASCTACDSTFFDLKDSQCVVNRTRYNLQRVLLDSAAQYSEWTKTSMSLYQLPNHDGFTYQVTTLYGTTNITYNITGLSKHSSLRFRMFIWITDKADLNSPGELTLVLDDVNFNHTFDNTYVKYLQTGFPDYYIYNTPDIPHNSQNATITLFLNATYTGYFNVAFKELMVFSKECASNCENCYMQNQIVFCSQCKVDYFNYKDNCYLLCPNGTYVAGDICLKCHETCKTCNSSASTSCTSCTNLLHTQRFLYQGSCLDKCPLKTYAVLSDLRCNPCAEGCVNCSGPTLSDCYFCEPDSNGNPYYLLASAKGCQKQCPPGQLYLSYITPSICMYCNTQCLTCIQNPYNCTSCHKNSSFPILFLHSCLQTCPLNYQLQNQICVCPAIGYWLSLNNCLKCHQSCEKCFGHMQFQCLSCKKDSYYVSEQRICRKSCPTGKFNLQQSNICMNCSSSCLSCINSYSNCQSCKNSTYLFNSTCVSICPRGYGAINYPNICKQCINQTSSYNNTCVQKCPPFYKSQNNVCIQSSFNGNQLDFQIIPSFVNKGTQFCLTLLFQTKIIPVHDIDDKIFIGLNKNPTIRLLQLSSQNLSVKAVDIDQSLMSLKLYISTHPSLIDVDLLNNNYLIIYFLDNILKSESGIAIRQYQSYHLNNPSFISQLYNNYLTSAFDTIGIVFSVIGILLVPLAYFKKYTYYPVIQFFMQIQLMRLLGFALYPVDFKTFQFLKGFDTSHFQWMPNIINIVKDNIFKQNSFVNYQFKSLTMNFLSLSASNLLFLLIFQPFLGYLFLYDKKRFIKFIFWTQKTLIYLCSTNLIFASWSSFISLFINTSSISIFYICSQLIGFLTLGFIIFFFIRQRKNYSKYKMFLNTSFIFCILTPFFSKSFAITLVLINIAQIAIIVISYKYRNKSDERTKLLLIGRCILLIMVDIVLLGENSVVVIVTGTLFFVSQLGVIGYFIYKSFNRNIQKQQQVVKINSQHILVKDEVKQQQFVKQIEPQMKQNFVYFASPKPEQSPLQIVSQKSPRKNFQSPRKNYLQDSVQNLRKNSKTQYSPGKNWRNYNLNKGKTIYKDQQSFQQKKQKQQMSQMDLSLNPFNEFQ